MPEEIQSLYWVQETMTAYPIVVLRKVGENVQEDHLVFLLDDKKHDVLFVKKCNEILHQHYADESMSINHDIEYNDGCASQFKCIRAFSTLARRNVKTTRVFCETSHGKSKSDSMVVWRSHLNHMLSVGSTRSSEMQRKESTGFFNK